MAQQISFQARRLSYDKPSESPVMGRSEFRSMLRFIIVNDQSINIVESSQFRELLLHFRPELSDEELPHQTRIRTAIIEAWVSWFKTLKEQLWDAAGALSYMTDIWLDQKQQSYLVITAHWLAYKKPQTKEDLTLCSALVAFHPLKGKHTGKNIADTIMKLLTCAGINPKKEAYWTMDGTSVNGTFIEEYYCMHRPNIVSTHEYYICCFPHLNHCIAQCTIKALNQFSQDRPDADDSDDNINKLGLQEIPIGLLAKLRLLIRTICTSGQCREALMDTIKQGNATGWWIDGKGEVTRIPPHALLLNVATHWDSTFNMLVCACELWEPIMFLKDKMDPNFKCVRELMLDDKEWKLVGKMIMILLHSHQAQHAMSAELTPVLAETIPRFEFFMTQWEQLMEKWPNFALIMQPGLDLAYQYYKRMDNTTAYVMAMFIHPLVQMFWIRENWEPEYIRQAEGIIKAAMNKYCQRMDNALPVAVPAPPAQSSKRHMGYLKLGLPSELTVDDNDDDLHFNDVSIDITSIDEEFKSYMMGACTKLTISIIKFWETHSMEFLTIHAIAMDHLPIQALSVPAERVFSSAAETDTNRQSQMSPVLKEALQMLKYAWKREPADFISHLLTPNDDVLKNTNCPSSDLLRELTAPTLSYRNHKDIMDKIVQAIN